MITGAIDEEYEGISEDPESDDFLGDDDELENIENHESEDIGDDEHWAYLEKADRKYKESKEDN
jgi:hypothetical protein